MPCCMTSACSGSDCLQLTEREALVCATICSGSEPVAFSTIRKTVGFHQEVVSRILRRLLNHRAIQKVGGGYKRVGR